MHLAIPSIGVSKRSTSHDFVLVDTGTIVYNHGDIAKRRYQRCFVHVLSDDDGMRDLCQEGEGMPD